MVRMCYEEGCAGEDVCVRSEEVRPGLMIPAATFYKLDR